LENKNQPEPAAIAFIRKKAQISESHARVVAALVGLPVPDEWTPLGILAGKIVVSSTRRAANG
jgi:hypothetical protein